MPTGERTTGQAIDELEGLYEFREPDAVRSYLAANSDLLPLVERAAELIPRHFPLPEPPVLTYVDDPEDGGDRGAVFALIPTWLDWADASPRLRRLDRDLLAKSEKWVASRFNVDVERR